MSKPQPDYQESLRYLKLICPEGPWVITAISQDHERLPTRTFVAGEEPRLLEWLANYGREHNIYYTLNRVRRAISKKPVKDDIESVGYLHVDVDPRAGEELQSEQERILGALQSPEACQPPTAIVFSGGGFQAFWKLEEPVAVGGRPEQVERLNQQLILLLGGDIGTHNIDRIMRLPGTVNRPDKRKREKGRKPQLARLVEWHEDRVYRLSQFQAAPKLQEIDGGIGAFGGSAVEVNVGGNVKRVQDLAKELPSTINPRVLVAIARGRDDEAPIEGGDDSRSGWLFFSCCEMVRQGVDDETIYAIITDPDWKISESVLRDSRGKLRSERSKHRYAIRQIQRAHESVTAPELVEMNDIYAIVENVGGSCRIVKESTDPFGRPKLASLRIEGFKQVYSNRFMEEVVGEDKNGNPKVKRIPMGEWWMTHPMRRTFEEIVFDPNEEHDTKLNLWRGFSYDAVPGDCSMYLEHVRDVICGGVEEHFEYLMNWMARAVQYPGQPGETAVVLRGGQGVGKGTFASEFGSLFGSHFKQLTNPKHITGQFNSVLEDAVVVFADEAFAASSSSSQESALKALITEPLLAVEKKGVDVLQSRNCVHLIMSSNKEWVVRADFDDRRLFVLQVSDEVKGDHEYFARLKDQMEHGKGRQALLHFLLNRDISKFNVRNVPKTSELRYQQLQTFDTREDWWFDKLQSGRLVNSYPGWPGQVIKEELQEDFIQHQRRFGGTGNRHSLLVSLALFLKRMMGSNLERKILSGQHTIKISGAGEITIQDPECYSVTSLDQCRQIWERLHGPVEWPSSPDRIDDPDEVF